MIPLIAPPPKALTPTRSAALIVPAPGFLRPPSQDEPVDMYRWPAGIEYGSVAIPEADSRDAFLDPLDVLDLLDD